jgi:glycerophosphoryl diester phosphodiesterase
MTNRKLIVAHRGARVDGHTNTLDAFDWAIRLGADMLEFDVRRTGDLEMVVHHDDRIGARPLSEMDLAGAVREAAGRGFCLPTLRDLLVLASGRIMLDVELKEGGYEEQVLRLIVESRFRISDFVVTSFDPETLARVTFLSPGVRTGLLIDADGGRGAYAAFEASGADFLAPHYTIVDEDLLERAARAAVGLLPWTVNAPGDIRRLLGQSSVAGVITDDAAEGIRLRRAP